MNIRELADSMRESFEAAPADYTESQRWYCAAVTALQHLNARPVCASLFRVRPDGLVEEITPPIESAA